MREIVLGPDEGTQIVVEEGANAQGSMVNNRVQRLDGGIPFAIRDAIGPVGTGSLAFSMPEGSSDLDAEATFTLTDNYGFPDRTSTTAYFKAGSEITVTMAAGVLEAAQVEGLGFAIVNPNAELGGQIDGSITGALDFQTGMVDATGSAAMTVAWPVPVAFGEFTFGQGGSISATIAESELTQLNGDMPFTASINSEHTLEPIAIEGNLNGAFDKDEGKLDGSANGSLVNTVIIPLENGDEFHILTGAVNAVFSGEEGLSELGFSASAEYHRDGELFMSGQVENGEYHVDDGTISFNAGMTLEAPFEKSNEAGTFTFRALPDSALQVVVSESNLDNVTGNLNFEVDDEELLLKGAVTDLDLDLTEEPKISGALDLRTAREFVHPRTGEEDTETAEGYQFVVEEESGVSGTITENEVQEVTADLLFRVDLNETELAKGNIGGTWNMPSDEFTGGGQVALTNDMPLVSTTTGGEQGQTPPEPTGEGAGRFESYTAFLAKGSNVVVQMAANELERATVSIDGFLNRGRRRSPKQASTASTSSETRSRASMAA